MRHCNDCAGPGKQLCPETWQRSGLCLDQFLRCLFETFAEQLCNGRAYLESGGYTVRQHDEKRRYTRPKIVSERVFEQAALACAQYAFFAGAPLALNLKQNDTTCGFSSS